MLGILWVLEVLGVLGIFLHHALLRNLEALLPHASTPRRTALEYSTPAKATLGKASPYLTCVLTVGQELISLNDGVAGVDERGFARLDLHSVDNKLQEEGVAVREYMLLGMGFNFFGRHLLVAFGKGWQEIR